MVFAGMNYLAILIAALAAFAWGAIYYMTLSKQWLAAVGITGADADRPVCGAVHHLLRGAASSWPGCWPARSAISGRGR